MKRSRSDANLPIKQLYAKIVNKTRSRMQKDPKARLLGMIIPSTINKSCLY
jgi:hypothetical protein